MNFSIKFLMIFSFGTFMFAGELDIKKYEIDIKKSSYSFSIDYPNQSYCHTQIISTMKAIEDKMTHLSFSMQYSTTSDAPTKLILQKNFHGLEATVGPDWLFSNTYKLEVNDGRTFAQLLGDDYKGKIYVIPLRCNIPESLRKTH